MPEISEEPATSIVAEVPVPVHVPEILEESAVSIAAEVPVQELVDLASIERRLAAARHELSEASSCGGDSTPMVIL